jgi:hypothetical protein
VISLCWVAGWACAANGIAASASSAGIERTITRRLLGGGGKIPARSIARGVTGAALRVRAGREQGGARVRVEAECLRDRVAPRDDGRALAAWIIA